MLQLYNLESAPEFVGFGRMEIMMYKNDRVHILHTAPLMAGGITSFVINVASLIDKNKYTIDNLCFRNKKEFSEELFCNYGGIKYVADIENVKFKPAKIWKKFWGTYYVLKGQSVDVFHIDTDSPDQIFLAAAAKLAGTGKVIYHSHNTSSGRIGGMRKMIELLCKPMMFLFVDEYLACSEVAAEFLFPASIVRKKRYLVVNNGIHVDKYLFNPLTREEYRQKFGYTDKLIIGHIGRFNRQKNHTFLIDIFEEIHNIEPKAVLFLIGMGELENEIREKVRTKKLEKVVCFFGGTTDVANLLQMMDVFLFPSLYEGLPVAGIEVQAAGLPMVLSDTITTELAVTNLLKFVSLNETPRKWADTVLEHTKTLREETKPELRRAGYDIIDTVRKLETIYDKEQQEI